MISIVIIVKNDRDVEAPITILYPKISKDIELIVVDSSKKEVLLDIREKYPLVEWIYYENKNKNKSSIPEQRNVGVNNSKGDIIVFVDSGCYPDQDWLESLIKPIQEEQELVVCGALHSKGEETHRDYFRKKNEFTKYLNECPTANLAIKREVFNTVGLFDERFNYGSDTDLSWRIRDNNIKIRYAPKAIIYFDWGSGTQEKKRAVIYGKARADLYRKHRSHLIRIIKSDFVTIIYPIFIVGLPLTILFPWYPLLLLVPIIKNWHNKPFETIKNHLLSGYGFLIGLVTSKIS